MEPLEIDFVLVFVEVDVWVVFYFFLNGLVTWIYQRQNLALVQENAWEDFLPHALCILRRLRLVETWKYPIGYIKFQFS